MSALQVAVGAAATHGTVSALDHFAALTTVWPSRLSHAEHAVLKAVLIVEISRLVSLSGADGWPGMWRQLPALLEADAQTLPDRYRETLKALATWEPEASVCSRDPRVEAALRYIRRRCTERTLRIDDVARLVHLSRCHLQRLLRTKSGASFKTHVRRARVMVACDLLRSPGHSLKEVAYSSGYPHPSELSRDFQKEFHASPKAWLASEAGWHGRYRRASG